MKVLIIPSKRTHGVAVFQCFNVSIQAGIFLLLDCDQFPLLTSDVLHAQGSIIVWFDQVDR